MCDKEKSFFWMSWLVDKDYQKLGVIILKSEEVLENLDRLNVMDFSYYREANTVVVEYVLNNLYMYSVHCTYRTGHLHYTHPVIRSDWSYANSLLTFYSLTHLLPPPPPASSC
jgi:hypothetical protein